MDKKVVLSVVGLVIVVAIGGYFLTQKNTDSSKPNSSASSTSATKENVSSKDAPLVAVDACNVLTDQAAKQLLGEAAVKGAVPPSVGATGDISVSNCTYYTKSDTGSIMEQAASKKTASVLARSAKTKTGADSNKVSFTSGKPADSQDVTGYGDKAFWSPKMGQLNILKGNNWYILTYYTGTKPNGVLDQVKQLADAIANNLQ